MILWLDGGDGRCDISLAVLAQPWLLATVKPCWFQIILTSFESLFSLFLKISFNGEDDDGDVGGLSWFSHRRNSGRHTPGNAPRTSAVIIIVIIIITIIVIVIVIANAIIIIVLLSLL